MKAQQLILSRFIVSIAWLLALVLGGAVPTAAQSRLVAPAAPALGEAEGSAPATGHAQVTAALQGAPVMFIESIENGNENGNASRFDASARLRGYDGGDGTVDQVVVLQNTDSPQGVSITKTVMPMGQVAYGDELTYTLVISAAPGAQVALYDPLEGTTFAHFLAQPTGIEHANSVITGTLTVTPTDQITVSFVAQVGVPDTVGWTVAVTNCACVYPAGGTLADCVWSNEVTNPALRFCNIYLPLILRKYTPLQADFTAWPTTGVAPLTVVFTNTSTGNFNTSLWSLGDGSTSTQTHPIHTYTATGTYTVALTVSKMDGTLILPGNTSTLTRTNYITVSEYSPPQAPGDLQATPISFSQIRLDWQDNSSDETGFTIYDGITMTNIEANTISYTVGGLAPASYHCFRIRAFNDHGNSNWSDWACATTFTCTEGIANGGFEDDGGWEFPVTPYPATYTMAITHTGSRAVRTGIVDPADNRESFSSVQQTVSIPADVVSATLRFWVYPISGEPPLTPTVTVRPSAETLQDMLNQSYVDMQYVWVLNEDDEPLRYLLWRRSDEQRWTLYEHDMTIHAGQTIKLRFGSVNNGADGVTAMYVDDVSLEICGSATCTRLGQDRFGTGVSKIH